MIKAVYFDLDGTLTDSAPGIINAIKYLQKKKGLTELTDTQLRSCIGPPLTSSFMKFWNADFDTAEHFLDIYREYYTVTGIYENEPFPGIEDMLKRLNEANTECRVCSSKPEVMVHTVLEHFGLKKYFSVLTGAPLHGHYEGKREALKSALRKNPAKAVMVGDRHDDIEAAQYAGIPSIGALWGYGGADELKKAGADYIANEANDIITYVNAVFG